MVILAMALASCGGGGGAPAGPSAQEKGSPLNVTLATGKPVYATGEPIPLTLTVSNTSKEPVELHFTSGQRYEFVIQNQAGMQMWSWASERLFLQVLGTERFAPGEERAFTEPFHGTLPAGAYTVTGGLTAREETPEARATFRIE